MANEREISILVKAKDEASKTLKGVADTAADSSVGFDIAVKAIDAVAIAAAAAATAVSVFVASSFKSFVDLGDQLAKMSIKTGVSVETLSELKYAADLSDVSMDQINTTLKKLQLNMGEALDGNSGMAESFDKIGLSTEDLKTMNAEDVFFRIADAVNSAKTTTEQSAIAFDLLGKQGQEMLPMLTSDISGLRQEANDLGIVMSTDTAKATEAFNDNLTRAKAAIAGVGQNISQELFIFLDPLIGKLVDVSFKFNEWFTTMGGITGIKDTVILNIGEMSAKFDENTGLITAMKDAFDTVAKLFVERIKPAFDKMLEAIRPYIPALEKVADLIGVVVVVALQALVKYIETIAIGVMAALELAIRLITAALELGKSAWDLLVTSFQKVLEWGQKIIDMYYAIIKAAKEAAQWVGSKLGIGGGVSNVGNGTSVGIGSYSMAGAGGVTTEMSVGGAMGFADGGIVTKPTLAMIGEAGESEAVIPLSKLPSLLRPSAQGAGGITVNINGGNYLSENAAEMMGNLIVDKLKNKFIL